MICVGVLQGVGWRIQCLLSMDIEATGSSSMNSIEDIHVHSIQQIRLATRYVQVTAYIAHQVIYMPQAAETSSLSASPTNLDSSSRHSRSTMASYVFVSTF